MKTRAAAYIRVSTDDQTEYSPEAQKKALQKYADTNNMMLLDKYIYVDEGISGRKAEKRPAFMNMISAAKSKEKPFDVILVHKFDRFARSREDSVVYKSLLRNQCGIKVISITENIEDDKISIIVEPMLEALAEYYSVNLAEEVKKGMTEKATRGEYQTTAAYGYEWSNGNLIINENEAKFVKYIFDNFLAGVPQIQIAKNINEMGARTHRGNTFENRNIEYILNNPLYAGYTRWTPSGKMLSKRIYNSTDTIVVKGNHPSIITQETFDKTKDRLALIKTLNKRKSRPATEYKHYLSSLVKCSACGASLSYSGATEYMQCWRYNHGKCKSTHSIKIEKLEKSTEIELKKLIESTNITDYVKNINIIPKSINDINIYNEQIKKNEKRLKRLKAGYLDGLFDLSEYKLEKEQIEQEIKKLKCEIKNLNNKTFDEEQFKKRVINTYDILTNKSSSNLEKSTAIKSIIEKIVYNKPNNELIFYYFY